MLVHDVVTDPTIIVNTSLKPGGNGYFWNIISGGGRGGQVLGKPANGSSGEEAVQVVIKDSPVILRQVCSIMILYYFDEGMICDIVIYFVNNRFTRDEHNDMRKRGKHLI